MPFSVIINSARCTNSTRVEIIRNRKSSTDSHTEMPERPTKILRNSPLRPMAIAANKAMGSFFCSMILRCSRYMLLAVNKATVIYPCVQSVFVGILHLLGESAAISTRMSKLSYFYLSNNTKPCRRRIHSNPNPISRIKQRPSSVAPLFRWYFWR